MQLRKVYYCFKLIIRVQGDCQCLLKTFQSLLIIKETHKPEIKPIHSSYFHVFLGWFLHVLTSVNSFNLCKWDQNLQQMKYRYLVFAIVLCKQRERVLIFLFYICFLSYLVMDSDWFSTCRRELDWSLTAERDLVSGDKQEACNGTCCSWQVTLRNLLQFLFFFFNSKQQPENFLHSTNLENFSS